MCQSNSQLDALGRILCQVKACREEPENTHKPAYGDYVNKYLSQRLSPADWEFWQALYLDWELSK